MDAPELLRDERGAPLAWQLFEIALPEHAGAPGCCAALATQDPGRPTYALRAWVP
jgi:hypothetical protein